MDGLNKAIAHFGTRKALAEAIGVHPMAVTQWGKRQRVPAERAVEIEKASGGAVTRHDLRPDLWPSAEKAA